MGTGRKRDTLKAGSGKPRTGGEGAGEPCAAGREKRGSGLPGEVGNRTGAPEEPDSGLERVSEEEERIPAKCSAKSGPRTLHAPGTHQVPRERPGAAARKRQNWPRRTRPRAGRSLVAPPASRGPARRRTRAGSWPHQVAEQEQRASGAPAEAGGTPPLRGAIAAPRGPTAGGGGCCCRRRSHPSPAPRPLHGRPRIRGPEQVTWCRDRPPPAPPSPPPPAGGRHCRRTRRLHCRSRRRRPRSPSRAPCSLPASRRPRSLPPLRSRPSPPPGRSLRRAHPRGQPAPRRWGPTPARPLAAAPGFPARSFVPFFPLLPNHPPAPPAFRTLSLPNPSPPPSFSHFPSPQFSHSFLSLPNPPPFPPPLSLLSQSPLPSLPSFSHSVSASRLSPPLTPAGPSSAVQWVFVRCFWRGRHSLRRRASVPPESRLAAAFQSSMDFDPCQPPPVHLQGRGPPPCLPVSARVVPHPASWFAAFWTLPDVLCPTARFSPPPPPSSLFLIVQSIGAQAGFCI